MIDIRDTVYDVLTYLVRPDEDTAIDNETRRSQLYIGGLLGKPEADLYDTTKYTDSENIVVAYHCAYMLHQRQMMRVTAGENGNAPVVARNVKSAKADVVETEFFEPNSSNSLVSSALEINDSLKMRLCPAARAIGLVLADICSNGMNLAASVTMPFRKYK
jgi:hypothetical protein